MKKSHGIGDLVVFNETGEFGNNNDCLFHIHSVTCGTRAFINKKQYWYAGYLLEIGEYESDGLPQVPIFRATKADISEYQLKVLDNLGIRFDPYC